MIVYTGPIDDPHELIQFFRRELNKLRTLRKLVVSRENSFIQDVNGDRMEFPGLTHGCPVLDRLLRELGIVFPAKTLHDPNSTPDGVREFDLSACWTWGHG
jgi:hypothetical protein